jgi:glycosyltransferase involved in cell wall biosynthesis
VGVVARLSPEKGQDTFLEAAAMVLREVHDVGFVIAGDAALGDRHYAERLVDLARRLGMVERTLFTGFTDRVPELMAGLDVLVVPSHAEPFGLVTVEAMASGTPVVATRTGGSPEIVEHEKTGLLVPPRDPAAIARAVLTLLRSPDRARALGETGRRRATDAFSIELHALAMRELYEAVLEAT